MTKVHELRDIIINVMAEVAAKLPCQDTRIIDNLAQAKRLADELILANTNHFVATNKMVMDELVEALKKATHVCPDETTLAIIFQALDKHGLS